MVPKGSGLAQHEDNSDLIPEEDKNKDKDIKSGGAKTVNAKHKIMTLVFHFLDSTSYQKMKPFKLSWKLRNMPELQENMRREDDTLNP